MQAGHAATQVPDMQMSCRLYLPGFVALNLTSTSCPSSSASPPDSGPTPSPGAQSVTADSLPSGCPSSIFWMVLRVFGLDSSDVDATSAATQQSDEQQRARTAGLVSSKGRCCTVINCACGFWRVNFGVPGGRVGFKLGSTSVTRRSAYNARL